MDGILAFLTDKDDRAAYEFTKQLAAASEFSPERPALSTVYRYENIGFYCFYGPGNIEICMIPLTEKGIETLRLQGTEIIEI